MTDRIEVSAGERGRVRVFAIDAPAPEAKALAADPQRIALALGLTEAEADGIEAFPVSTLEGVGLMGYLAEGYGIDPEDLERHKDRIEALGGHVVLVASRAFGGRAATLTVAPPLSLVATLDEERQVVSFDDLPSGGAETRTALGGVPAHGQPAGRRGRSHWTGIAVILVIVVLFIFFGGVR